jgi:hypothetical protein
MNLVFDPEGVVAVADMCALSTPPPKPSHEALPVHASPLLPVVVVEFPEILLPPMSATRASCFAQSSRSVCRSSQRGGGAPDLLDAGGRPVI